MIGKVLVKTIILFINFSLFHTLQDELINMIYLSIYVYQYFDIKHATINTNTHTPILSHLMGIFYRTIRMIENGLKPVYVFDGKPPQMKSHEVYKQPLSSIFVLLSLLSTIFFFISTQLL